MIFMSNGLATERRAPFSVTACGRAELGLIHNYTKNLYTVICAD